MASLDIPGSKLARRLSRSIQSLWRRQEESPDDDPERTSARLSDSPQIPATAKLIIVRNKEDSAPNLLLNIDRFSSPGELWAFALVGIVLQFGVLLYSGFITYHPAVMFQKGGLPIEPYAYPCTAIGTVLLVGGLLICSHVVESSTRESFYRPKQCEARMVYLQKAGTAADQYFGSFAIFAKEGKSVIATSRREPIGPVHEFKTVLGTLITLLGFVVQFVGLRSMHWSATIAQLGATIIMTVVRAWVRRDLSSRPIARKLSPGLELDWLATKLALRFFPGLPDTESDEKTASLSQPHERASHRPTQKTRDADSRGTRVSNTDWLELLRKGKETGATDAHEAQNWIPKVIGPSDTPGSETLAASTAHHAVRLRKGLADLAPWPRSFSAEARAVATAIEGTLKFLDSLSAFSPPAETVHAYSKTENGHKTGSDLEPKKDTETGNDDVLGATFKWHVETVRQGKVFLTARKQPNGRWKAPETDIEALLSLWNYGAHAHEPKSKQAKTIRPEEKTFTKVDPGPQRILRLLGVNSARLRRDLRWWVPNETLKVMAASRIRNPTGAAADSNVDSDYYHGAIGCDPRQRSPGWTEMLHYRTMELQRPFDTAVGGEHEDILLATVSDQPTRVLFSQHLFTSFMWALARQLRRPIPGMANVQATDLSQPSSPFPWQQFTLQNPHLSRMAQDIHATGLGSLEDIYLCIIPPLSLARRLPRTDSVVDWVSRRVVRPSLTWQPRDAVEAFVWMLATFPNGDPVEPHVAPSAVSLLLLLVHKRITQKQLEVSQDSHINRLERLKEELGSKAKVAHTTRHSLAVARERGPAWISEAARATMVALGLPSSPAEYPPQISAVLEGKSPHENPPAQHPRNGTRDAFGRTPLHYATISEARWWFVILSSGPMLNAQDRLGWTPLHFASSHEAGRSRVHRLIELGADVDLRTQDGLTPLHCAAMAGEAGSVVELINAGADVDGLDSSRNTALHWAALNGHDEVVDCLLPLTNPVLRTTKGRTALHLAALGAKVTDTQLRKMLDRGYDPVTKDRDGHVALHYAAWTGYESGVVVLSGEGDALLDAEDARGMRPADLAASRGHPELARRLLVGEGGDVEALRRRCGHQDRSGATILHHAAAGDCDTLLSFLISEGGMDPSAANTSDEMTALHYAAESGSMAALKYLVESRAGQDVTAERDTHHYTALHFAAEAGHKDCVLYLASQLPQGVTGWPVDDSSRTPLHLAAGRFGNVEVLRILLEKGCPVGQEDEEGLTALHCVADTGDTAMAKLLLEWKPQGAPIRALTKLGNEALFYAAYRGHLEMTKLLVDHGANIHCRNSDGRTPFLVTAEGELKGCGPTWYFDGIKPTVADMERQVEVLQFLVAAGADPNAVDHQGRNARVLCSRGAYDTYMEDKVERTRGPVGMYLDALLMLS